MYSAYELNKQGDTCLRWGKSSANNRITQELAGAWKVTHSTPRSEHSGRSNVQWLLSQWGHTSPPQPHTADRSTAKKQIWDSSPPTREHGLTAERTVGNTEPWGSTPQYPGQALVTVTQSKPKSREQGHTPLDQPHPPSCRHHKEDELGSCSLQKRVHRQKTGQNEMAKKWVIESEATSNLAWTTK